MCGFSSNVLPSLKEKYSRWINSEIVCVRILQKAELTFLEVTYNPYSVVREDLGFIDEDYDEPMFPPTQNPQDNAEHFVNELDLYSLVMTGIGDILFSDEGLSDAAKFCGAVEE